MYVRVRACNGAPPQKISSYAPANRSNARTVMLGLNLVNRLHNYYCHYILSATCSDGDVRVVGGDSEWEGRLEVCFNQRWGTVNGDGWSSVDTQVTCRQLGYETSGKWR